MSKSFCYLVQAASDFKASVLGLESPDADLQLLTFKRPYPGAIHAPGSSWNQGRNRLLEEAGKRGGDYLYYVLLDDDVEFDQGDFRSFETFLKQVRPAIGTPRQWDYNHRCEHLDLPLHSVYAFDACFNAFHRDVVEDGLLFPYVEQFDHESWWYSQVLMIHLANFLYGGRIVQDNGTRIRNGTNDGTGTNYPHDNKFSKVEAWLFDQLLASGTDRGWFRPHPHASRSAEVSVPSAMPQSHRLDMRAMEGRFRPAWWAARPSR